MFSPIEGAPASRAPRLAASMIPGPPPVMIAKPASPSIRAVARAAAYSGSCAGVRAEPKIDTAAPTCASASKPVRSSSEMRSIRAASVSWETTCVLLGGDDLLVERGGHATAVGDAAAVVALCHRGSA